MLIKYGDMKCKCCPLSVHGYGGAGADDAISLKPGVNTVTGAQYEKLKTNKIFQHRVETGTYSVDTKITGDSITGLSESSAIELVGETLDRAILNKWMVDEQRRDVRAAILAQLEKVKPEVKETPKGEGGKK